jgi:fructokinase
MAGLASAALSPHPPLALGVDLGGTKVEAVLLDARSGEQRWKQRVATPSGSYTGTVGAIVALVEAARSAAGGLAFSVGVGTPGSVTPQGLMKNCNSVVLNGQPLPADIETAIGLPVRIANDANCLALSEGTDGAGAGAEVVFAAILGTGCGAGIAVHQRVIAGPNGLAGEWGHNPFPWGVAGEDPVLPCYCGKAGCNETLLSGPAIAADFERATGRRCTAAEVAEAARAGDAAAAACLERHASRLARALASVINLLDPDVIVLGGGLSQMPHLYQRVPQLWSRWVVSGGQRDEVRTRLLPAQHGDSSGVRGAAWLWR